MEPDRHDESRGDDRANAAWNADRVFEFVTQGGRGKARGSTRTDASRTTSVHVDGAALHVREIGEGLPIIVLHGGPDFDHGYLLPALDRLSDSFRLIYYDQRGRGQSLENVRPDDVSMESEMRDLESLRRYFDLESAAILGHSWGGLLGLEYAIRHPDRVSHLILMNTAPVSRGDFLFMRQELHRRRAPGDAARLRELASTVEYARGDRATVGAYYRIHFSATLRRADQLDRLIPRLLGSSTPETIIMARAIEERLVSETWMRKDYDILSQLEELNIPTLVLHGDDDFIPVECAAHIAQAIPGARLVVLKDCGHFAYLERPEDVYEEVVRLFDGPGPPPGSRPRSAGPD